MKTRIGVLTSGGDCPGLNAVLRGVVLAGEKLGWEVIGFRDGFEGLLPPGDHVVLDRKSTEGIMALGGTIIGTTNRGHFIAKVGAGDRAVVASDVIAQAKKVLSELNVKALIIVGGDGSMTTAMQMQEAGIDCIGVPKTIDNDIEATAMTFGFDSAVAEVMDACDRLHTTATSHKRVMVVEVMGRHAGWIALHGGIAGGADIILIPEIPFDYDKIAAAILARADRGSLSAIVVVAEGACPRDGQVVMHPNQEGEYRLGGVGEIVAREIAARTRLAEHLAPVHLAPQRRPHPPLLLLRCAVSDERGQRPRANCKVRTAQPAAKAIGSTLLRLRSESRPRQYVWRWPKVWV